jgi:hypothetical protein
MLASACASVTPIEGLDGSGDSGGGSGDASNGDGTDDTGIADDTGADDTGTDDTDNSDTGIADDTGADTGINDDTGADTGTDDTATSDTGTDDTDNGDTGTDDTDNGDTGTDDTGIADDTGADTGSEDTGTDTEADTGPASVCGNGTVEAGEACDDGNRLPSDGCDINCQLPATGLCSRCGSDGDCPVRGGLCLPLGNGDYCGVGCGTGCPTGFSCELVTSVDGFSGRQCRPVSDACGVVPCDDADADTICDDRDTCAAGDDRIDTDADGIPEACDTPDEICTGGGDEDGDGAIDCDDPDCGADPTCLAGPREVCDNATDDDADGAVDCADSDCSRAVGCVPTTETSCTDTVDNDLDGNADCADADCATNVACRPTRETVCDNGLDEDGDRAVDCADADCVDAPSCIPRTEANCADGVDNDRDRSTDCADTDCTASLNCVSSADGSCGNPFLVDGPGIYGGDASGADNTANPGCRTASTGNEDEVWDLTFDVAATYCIDTVGTSWDTLLYLRETCGAGPDLACDDDGVATQSRFEYFFEAGVRYFLFVEAYRVGIAGLYTLRIRRGQCATLADAENCTSPADDDGDGSFNCGDTDCASNPACLPPAEVCNDSLDNDRDGSVDCADRDCASNPACLPPAEVCNDALDNDRDGSVDCVDPDCFVAVVCADETCFDDIDNNANGLIDCDDPQCDGDPTCGFVEDCENGVDDDFDGIADCSDLDCSTAFACLYNGTCAAPYPLPIDTVFNGTTSGTGATSGSCGGSSPEAVATFVAPRDGTFCFDTSGTTFDAVAYVRTTCSDPASQVACIDDVSATVTAPWLQFTATAGTAYSLFVDGYDGAAGDFTMKVSAGACPRGTAELCGDGVDNDGNGRSDCLEPTCYVDTSCNVPETCASPVVMTRDDAYITNTSDNDDIVKPLCGGERSPDAVYAFVGTGDVFCFDTIGSTFDTVMSYRTDCAGADLACDDDGAFAGTASQLEIMTTADTFYYVIVQGYSAGSSGNVVLNAQLGFCR